MAADCHSNDFTLVSAKEGGTKVPQRSDYSLIHPTLRCNPSNIWDDEVVPHSELHGQTNFANPWWKIHFGANWLGLLLLEGYVIFSGCSHWIVWAHPVLSALSPCTCACRSSIKIKFNIHRLLSNFTFHIQTKGCLYAGSLDFKNLGTNRGNGEKQDFISLQSRWSSCSEGQMISEGCDYVKEVKLHKLKSHQGFHVHAKENHSLSDLFLGLSGEGLPDSLSIEGRCENKKRKNHRSAQLAWVSEKPSQGGVNWYLANGVHLCFTELV